MSTKRKKGDRIAVIESHIDEVESILNSAVENTPTPAYKAEKQVVRQAVTPTPAPRTRSASGMTPEQRARAWYPNASAGGGNNRAVYNGVGHKFLWKPKSDSNGKAAVHTPHGLRINSLTVGGKTYSPGSYGNGWRPLFRVDKPGSAYGSNVQVTMNLHGGQAITVVVPNGGSRFEKNFPKPEESAPAPSTPAPAPAPVQIREILLPPQYAAKVGLVAVMSGRKMHPCTRDPANPARWTHTGKKSALYGIRWNVVPAAKIAVYNAGPLGLWSVTDGELFLTTGEIVTLLLKGEPAPPVVVPPEPPKPAPAESAPLYTRTPTSLTLRQDLADACRYVDALANNSHANGNKDHIRLTPVRTGNTWTLPQPLESYKTGAMPNTWRLALAKGKTFPAGVTWHTSIAQTFIQTTTQAGKFYPPTTRA